MRHGEMDRETEGNLLHTGEAIASERDDIGRRRGTPQHRQLRNRVAADTSVAFAATGGQLKDR